MLLSVPRRLWDIERALCVPVPRRVKINPTLLLPVSSTSEHYLATIPMGWTWVYEVFQVRIQELSSVDSIVLLVDGFPFLTTGGITTNEGFTGQNLIPPTPRHGSFPPLHSGAVLTLRVRNPSVATRNLETYLQFSAYEA